MVDWGSPTMNGGSLQTREGHMNKYADQEGS